MWQRTKNAYHLGNAILANIVYGFASRSLTVIGVTGTDGKTTTVKLIYHILRSSGFNVSMISSVGAIIGDKDYDVGFHVTTPSSWALQRFLRRTVGLRLLRQFFQASGSVKAPQTSNYLVLEVTSHALDQYRVWGIKFDVGVLTNVTHEHLDYHKTYENYVKIKSKLLQRSRVAIINRDDESFRQISNFKFLISKLVTYGMSSSADINPENFTFKSNLIGDFNRYNILAAVGACKALGIKDDIIRRGIKNFVLPKGRADVIYNKDFRVMIDFAHTPNAFEGILRSIKPNIKGRLIHVFGSAGERDVAKRPLMGKVSSKHADIIILTSEDPRSESVEKIMNEIESGIENSESRIQNGTLLRIEDRKKAIETAIKMAKKEDFVLITGKSHERSMNYGQGEVSWDEYGTVNKILNIKNQK